MWRDARDQEAFAVGVWHSTLEIEIAALVASNLPPKLGTLNDVMQQALDAIGICCDKAVDEFIAKRAGPDMVGDLEHKFPEFRPEWFSLAGAREYREAKRGE